MGKFASKAPALVGMVLTVVAAFASGCSMSQKTVGKPAAVPLPLKSATKTALITAYDELANSITSLNAAVTIRLTAGSTYTGTIEQYHEINGFILAQKPAHIRVIGQVPVVGKDIFDMESGGETFHIFIPSKNQYLVGPTNLEGSSSKPVENLRPQHLLDAIFWESVPNRAPVLLEETAAPEGNFYILTVVRGVGANGAAPTAVGGPGDWEIARKIWFERSHLNVARIDTFELDGKPAAITRYSQWDMFGPVRYPRQISLDRPQNDYQLQLTITRLTANDAIAPDRFALPQPPGAELIRLGKEAEENKP
jgi:hypothetical protein